MAKKELNDLLAAAAFLAGNNGGALWANKASFRFFRRSGKINEEFAVFRSASYKAELSLAKIKKEMLWGQRRAGRTGNDAADENKEKETGVEISVSHPKKKNLFAGNAIGRRKHVGCDFLCFRHVADHLRCFYFRRTDAALDEANRKIRSMSGKWWKNQFVVIYSANRETCDRLILPHHHESSCRLPVCFP